MLLPWWATAAAARRMRPRPGLRPCRGLDATLGEERRSLSGEGAGSRETLWDRSVAGGWDSAGQARQGRGRGTREMRFQGTPLGKPQSAPHPRAPLGQG